MCALEHKALGTSRGVVRSDSTLLRTQVCHDSGARKQRWPRNGSQGGALLRPACSLLPVLRACGKLESLLKGCLRRQSEPGSPVALHHVLTEDAVSGPGVWLWSCLDRVSGVAPARLPPPPHRLPCPLPA